MQAEWNRAKAARNALKHGVRFADAVTALEDDRALTIADTHAEGEDRYVSVGMDVLGRILVTVYALRGERVRIISSRKASRSERDEYTRQR